MQTITGTIKSIERETNRGGTVYTVTLVSGATVKAASSETRSMIDASLLGDVIEATGEGSIINPGRRVYARNIEVIAA